MLKPERMEIELQINFCISSLYLTGIQLFNNQSCDYRIKDQGKSEKANKNDRDQLPKWNRLMHPKMNDAYLKIIFYWIRPNLTYIGNKWNYGDYAGIMPESSLAALLSSNESASAIKCITKPTRTVKIIGRKKRESRGHFVTTLSVWKHWSSVLLRTVQGGGEIPVLPGNQIKPCLRATVEGWHLIILKPRQQLADQYIWQGTGAGSRSFRKRQVLYTRRHGLVLCLCAIFLLLTRQTAECKHCLLKMLRIQIHKYTHNSKYSNIRSQGEKAN